MHPTLLRSMSGGSLTLAVAFVTATFAAQEPKSGERVRAGMQQAGSAVAQEASLVGGALPGGAVISAAVSSVSNLSGSGGGAASASYAATGRVILEPPDGGEPVETSLDKHGEFWFDGLRPGKYSLRISMGAATPKQTQGATFGEKTGESRPRHEAAMGSIRNIKARTDGSGGDVDPGAAANKAGDNAMPNRISMNVSVARQTLVPSKDGESVVVEVGADGKLTGRASVQQQEAAQSSSGKVLPKGEPPPPRPSGG